MGLDISKAPGLAPSQDRVALPSNYMSFTDGTRDFAQQYLPELYEAEVERFGNRTLSGFLRMVGAEMPMTSDQVIWSEQNRLHVSYDDAVVATSGTIVNVTLPSGNQGATDECAIRVGQTVVISDGLNTVKAKVRTVTTSGAAGSRVAAVRVDTYQVAELNAGGLADAAAVKIFVYGSEFAKGTSGMDVAIEPNFTQFNNKPIILKDFYEVSGSDAAQIGWVEVATEDGTSGYLWYLKAESETRLRFEDYLEMSMVEAEKKVLMVLLSWLQIKLKVLKVYLLLLKIEETSIMTLLVLLLQDLAL